MRGSYIKIVWRCKTERPRPTITWFEQSWLRLSERHQWAQLNLRISGTNGSLFSEMQRSSKYFVQICKYGQKDSLFSRYQMNSENLMESGKVSYRCIKVWQNKSDKNLCNYVIFGSEEDFYIWSSKKFKTLIPI